jgi:hypothetical protein
MLIVPNNWAELQHYKDRSPPWIKLHKKLLDNFEFQSLPVASRALAPMLWLLASEHGMSRDEALLKLLALEPETRARLIVVTGWDSEDTEAVLDTLVAEGKVTYRNGHHGATGERLYYPKRVPQADVGALPVAAGKSRKSVRNVGGGLLRGERPGLAGWPWTANPQGSGGQASCTEGAR